MSVKVLGSRFASAWIRDLASRIGRERGDPVAVERRELPYWQVRGWTRNGNRYSGNYQTPYGAFQGWAECWRRDSFRFYIYNPPNEVRRCSHWPCFQHQGNDRYEVHMGVRPSDVSSGIMTIERLIREAFESGGQVQGDRS